MAVDPTSGLDLPKPGKGRERVASLEEAVALIAALPARDRGVWATAMYAGLRRGELRALRWSDVDLKARTVRVERGWDDQEGEQAPKTERARRTVFIDRRLESVLRARQLATGRRGSDLVFGATASDPFLPTSLRRRAIVTWRAAGLEPIGLHECRHTFASVAIHAG